jgi:hypothetical protein
LIATVLLRELGLDAAAHPRGQAHLSAASGLVAAGRYLYVVADDEHHLGVLDAEAGRDTPVVLRRLLAGDLPHGKRERKRLKPDLEALAWLPASGHAPGGSLLALGSGSRPNRELACLAPLDASGALLGPVRTVPLGDLYRPLHARFAQLNIEGAFVCGARLCLLQRANKAQPHNACIAYALQDFVGWLDGEGLPAPEPQQVTTMALGHADGVPFGFTDGAAGPDGGWVFSAVAEDSEDSYADGRCAASAIGWVSAQGELRSMQRIAGSPKVEGIAPSRGGGLLLVTDADDPERPSRLLRTA